MSPEICSTGLFLFILFLFFKSKLKILPSMGKDFAAVDAILVLS